MAQTVTGTHTNILAKLVHPFQVAINSIGWFCVQIVENNSKLQRFEYLQSLSDEELAKRGLTRDRIVHHVFKDVMYI